MTADIAPVAPRRFLTAPPDGLIAAFLLSLLGTAGLLYVNIMAPLVSGLIDGLHFDARDAGFVASANVYGAAFGALIAVFSVKRIAWRPTAALALLGLIAIDIASTQITSPMALIVTRAVHGTIGGFLVGVAYSVFARTRTPDRVFGMLLVVQFGLAGAGLMFLPGLVPVYGMPVLFLALAAFSLLALMTLPLLADYPRRDAALDLGTGSGRVRWGPLIVALLSMFLFQAGNMILAAYMIEIGRSYGLDLDFISRWLGIAAWIGVLGSVAVIVLGTRVGRFRPLAFAMVLVVISNAAFYFSGDPIVFVAANIAGGVTWAFTIPYLLGLAAAFDSSGQTAAMGGFFSKMGLATGPLVGGFIMAQGNPPLLITVAVAALVVSCASLIPALLIERAAKLPDLH